MSLIKISLKIDLTDFLLRFIKITIIVVDENDRTAPTAEILSPDSGTVINGIADITGTAKDDKEFKCYSLSISKYEEDNFAVFEQSNNARENELLASLDTSIYEDGVYKLRHTAEDAVGDKKTIQFV